MTAAEPATPPPGAPPPGGRPTEPSRGSAALFHLVVVPAILFGATLAADAASERHAAHRAAERSARATVVGVEREYDSYANFDLYTVTYTFDADGRPYVSRAGEYTEAPKTLEVRYLASDPRVSWPEDRRPPLGRSLVGAFWWLARLVAWAVVVGGIGLWLLVTFGMAARWDRARGSAAAPGGATEAGSAFGAVTESGSAAVTESGSAAVTESGSAAVTESGSAAVTETESRSPSESDAEANAAIGAPRARRRE